MKNICLFVLLILLIHSCKDNTQNENKNLAVQTLELDSISFTLPSNFELEELYSPSDHGQGSWVALAQGPNQKIYACDQRGKIYHFNMPAIGKKLKPTEVDSINLPIGEAHGLLWAFDSLYVAVNSNWQTDEDGNERGSGVYRLTDTDSDGALDTISMLLKLEGHGEHGPHSFKLSPDGKEIYFIAGNYVEIPEKVKKNSRLSTNWGEDQLFEPYLDARGHANELKAPGAWIAKFKPDGSEWELISAGYRNPFDMAFNPDGELFAYDADMEWDIGMPWYRPTRICHAVSGSDYGWRTGSGKWPAYYPDNLPAVLNLEQGSPTGVIAASRLNFPSKYKNGLLVMDWSFGTIYFIDLKAKGSSYTAEREEFLSGVPLPLTDLIVGNDGNLYFATGGRGLDSHLYRLRHIGGELDQIQSKTKTDPETAELRALRRQLETFHTRQSKEGISLAWQHLNHDDRFIQYASRVALENQPVLEWQELFIQEHDEKKVVQGAIALARQGTAGLRSNILEKLNNISFQTLNANEQLNLLRAYALVFIRMGIPNEELRFSTIENLNTHFPHSNNQINRELAQLLLFLKADGITESLVGLLEKHAKEKTVTESVEMLSEEASLRSEQYGPLIREVIEKMPPSESIYYGMLLSHAEIGWTKNLRERYFQWFFDVLNAKGGMSFKAYIENVRQKAMTHVDQSEKDHYEKISGIYSPMDVMVNLPKPLGPGKQYSGKDINDLVWGKMNEYKGTLADGERAYNAAMCIVCHRMKGEGGATGPDLTQIHTKFNLYDLSFAIYSPNDEISDQYANTIFYQDNGDKVIGRLLAEDNDTLTIMPNTFNPSYTVKLAKSNITKRELSPVSPMPPGLLNRLSEQEILDLFAYLQSGANPNHEIYTRNVEESP